MKKKNTYILFKQLITITMPPGESRVRRDCYLRLKLHHYIHKMHHCIDNPIYTSVPITQNKHCSGGTERSYYVLIKESILSRARYFRIGFFPFYLLLLFVYGFDTSDVYKQICLQYDTFVWLLQMGRHVRRLRAHGRSAFRIRIL